MRLIRPPTCRHHTTLSAARDSVQADLLIKANNFFFGHGERGAGAIIAVVAERKNGVHAVIAAAQLHQEQNAVVARGANERRGRRLASANAVRL